MSLYHETAEVLSDASAAGSLRTRVFKRKGLKSPPAQVYALAVESCRWSGVLKEVIEGSEILRHERKLTPILSLLLVHDFLLAKSGIALPTTHGLRTTIERHKNRLASEFTRARLRRKQPTLDALRALVADETRTEAEGYPRWVRVNALRSDVEEQLGSTFKGFERVLSIKDVMGSSAGGAGKGGERKVYIDEHVPNLLAISPGVDLTKTEAYKSGALVLQDKASCFPAYMLDPDGLDGDVADACAAPGNKTTHLAAILHTKRPEGQQASSPKVFAFEKDKIRAETLARMVDRAGAKSVVRVALGEDFLKVDPTEEKFARVGALLLDPSCSGSGIVGRDSMPDLHLPEAPPLPGKPNPKNDKAKSKGKGKDKDKDKDSKKRKRGSEGGERPILVDDEGNEQVLATEQELAARLRALAAFQLQLLLHAFTFPAARRVTYSTCSIHAEENEGVVLQALASDVAKERGWRILRREEQVSGMKRWDVRGEVGAAGGDEVVAQGCVRSYKGDGRGVMGFFVAAFVRDGDVGLGGNKGGKGEGGEPYVRDEEGMIVRDVLGMPMLKATGEFVSLDADEGLGEVQNGDGNAEEEEEDESSGSAESDDDSEEDGDDEGDEWGGFDD